MGRDEPGGPAGLLRRAAELMKTRAGAATPGPWEAEDHGDCWQLFGAAVPGFPPLQLIKAPKHGTLYAEYWPAPADSAHIAAWHPGVALAVAAVLKHRASGHGDLAGEPGGADPDPFIALARIYLGGGLG